MKLDDWMRQTLLSIWIANSLLITAILAIILKWLIVYGWTFRVSMEVR